MLSITFAPLDFEAMLCSLTKDGNCFLRDRKIRFGPFKVLRPRPVPSTKKFLLPVHFLSNLAGFIRRSTEHAMRQVPQFYNYRWSEQ